MANPRARFVVVAALAGVAGAAVLSLPPACSSSPSSSPASVPPGTTWLRLGLHAVAKAFEVFDSAALARTGLVSGHPRKYLVAAAATGWVLRLVVRREPAAAGRASGRPHP